MIEFFKKYDWLGHILEATVMTLIAALFFLPFVGWKLALVIGAFGAAQHFYGREKRDYEVWDKIQAPHLVAYMFWRWNKDQLTDFLPVAGAALVLILFLI